MDTTTAGTNLGMRGRRDEKKGCVDDIRSSSNRTLACCFYYSETSDSMQRGFGSRVRVIPCIGALRDVVAPDRIDRHRDSSRAGAMGRRSARSVGRKRIQLRRFDARYSPANPSNNQRTHRTHQAAPIAST